MLSIEYHLSFKKDYKAIVKRGYDISKFEKVIEMLAKQEKLPEHYHDRYLRGIYQGFRECHIAPDWLLIYRVEKEELKLLMIRTGTHSDLF